MTKTENSQVLCVLKPTKEDITRMKRFLQLKRWGVFSGVNTVVSKLFDSFGIKNGKLTEVIKNPETRKTYLLDLKSIVNKHLMDLFSTRRKMDQIQEQIMNIKANAWNPDKNMPYCFCRPRRDVLEDDVSHLMERLHQAGDQACEMRERLLVAELSNLSLHFHKQQPQNMLVGNTKAIQQQKQLGDECRRLREEVMMLKCQLSGEAQFKSKPSIPQIINQQRVPRNPSFAASTSSLQEGSPLPLKKQSDVLHSSQNNSFSINHLNFANEKKAISKDYGCAKKPPEENGQGDTLNKCDVFYKKCLMLQQDLSDDYGEEKESTNVLSQLVQRITEKVRHLKQLIQNLETGFHRDFDQKQVHALSEEIRNLIHEIVQDRNTADMSNKTLLSLRQVSKQANEVLKCS